jgi:4-amino-4-deoxy-L-arabinose transferase-like glycosyltransferase
VPKPTKNAPVVSRWDSEVRLLAWLATCISVVSFLAYFQRGEVLLYGDAVAHLNIARRVFDSETPGLLQLGTVWLPLPHLLMIPFLISDEMWRRGVGGSIPSMAAYVFAIIGMFRLVRGFLSRDAEPGAPARAAAWTAALVFAANPNLIYMQSTAMGETLYLAFFLWAVVFFTESVRGDSKALIKCGLCLAAACLTRYDGWFLAVAMVGAVVAAKIFAARATKPGLSTFRGPALAKFVVLAAAAPALWLAYNGIIYRNPLEFENGPYSAKAIERKTQGADLVHPGNANPLLAGLYFVKSGEANLAANEWLQRGWVLLAVMGLLGTALALRRRKSIPDSGGRPALDAWPLLFLLVPLPFYALSVAYGGVLIYVPTFWPHTHYNVRYGLQLLPAFAAALGLLVYLALQPDWWNRKRRLGSVLALFTLVIASYASVWHAEPVCLMEAQINMRTRNQLERQLAAWLQKLPPDSTVLMYLGDHVGAIQQAGIPLKRVINEGNHRVWKQPLDPDGLWERTLANPARSVDYVVAFEGDPVWQAVQSKHLPALVVLHVSGQAPAVLYRVR